MLRCSMKDRVSDWIWRDFTKCRVALHMMFCIATRECLEKSWECWKDMKRRFTLMHILVLLCSTSTICYGPNGVPHTRVCSWAIAIHCLCQWHHQDILQSWPTQVWTCWHLDVECGATVSKKDVGMGLCLHVDLCFHASSLPCLHTFWHAIPTFFFLHNYMV